MRKRQLLSAFCLNRSFFFLFCPSNNYKKWLAFAPNFYLGFLQLRKSSLLSNLPSKELNGEKRSKSGANRDCDEITALFLGKKLTQSLSLTFSNTMTKTLCVTFIYRKTIKILQKLKKNTSKMQLTGCSRCHDGSEWFKWQTLTLPYHDIPFSIDYWQLACKLSSVYPQERRDPSNVFKDAVDELFQGFGN